MSADRELTRESLASEARRIAERSGDAYVSKRAYVRETGISEHQIYRLFPDGGWAELADLAGVSPHPRHNRPSELSREDIVAEAGRIAQSTGRTQLSRAEFVRESGISGYHINRLFPERGWVEVLALVGLSGHPQHKVPRSDEELLAEYDRAEPVKSNETLGRRI